MQYLNCSDPNELSGMKFQCHAGLTANHCQTLYHEHAKMINPMFLAAIRTSRLSG
jgi:hypothetical protein